MKKIILGIFLFPILLFSQTLEEINFYKSKLFLYPTIGTYSALIYISKVFSSKKYIDLAFAYTAKRYLLTITGKDHHESEYVLKINFYLKNVPETGQNYTDLSNVYNILGITDKINRKYHETLKKILKADDFAPKKDDIKQAIKIKGDIATLKIKLKQTDQAIAEVNEILHLMDKNKEQYKKENFEAVYNTNLSNLGYLYIDKFIADKKRNRRYLDSAMVKFNTILKTSKNKALIGDTYLKLGTIYSYKNKKNSTSQYYQKSLAIFDELQLQDKIPNLKYNIAVNFYERNKIREAKKLFIQLSALYKQDSIINTDYAFTQDYLSKIYLEENKKDSVIYYSDLFLALYEKTSQKEKEDILNLYKELNKKDLKTEIEKIKQQNKAILNNRLVGIIILSAIVLGTAIYSLFLFRKKEKLKIQLDELIRKVKRNEYQTAPDREGIKYFYTIGNEKEVEIIKKLLELVEKEYYLKPEFNQSTVAKKLGTNKTYLSQAINNYMKKTFSKYSNELRINYILKKLSEDKKMRSYTTQALAETVGYKNGDSFAKSFREKTGVTPFQYINRLNRESL